MDVRPAAMAILIAACGCGGATTPNVDWQSSHRLPLEARWLSDHEVELVFRNPNDFDVCIQQYQWPAPWPGDDVLLISDRDGGEATFVGDEPVVMGSGVVAIAAHSARNARVDVNGTYDIANLNPPFRVEFRVSFRRCWN